MLASEFGQWLNLEDAPAVVQHVKDRTAQDAQRVLTAVLREDFDADVDGRTTTMMMSSLLHPR